MKKITVLITGFIIIFLTATVFAGGNEPTNEELLKEIKGLKARVLELETRLMKQEGKIQSTENQTQEIKDKFEHIDTHLLHREEGLPAFFSDGFKIGAGATMIIQGTDDVNADSVTDNEAATDASYSVDLELEKKLEDYGKIFLHLETGKGNGIEDELKVFSNANQDVLNNENVEVAEIWYEHYVNDLAIITFGKLDPTVYFDNNAIANDETTQFLGRMFRNSPVIEFPGYTGGLRLALAPNDKLELNLGYFDADADWEDITDGPFFIGQVNIKPNLFKKKGNYRLLAWLNNKNHIKWSDTTQNKESGYGWGLSFDQELTKNASAFFRYGWQNPDYYLNDQTYSLESSWSGGLQLSGELWGRENDVWALAIGQIFPSKDYKDSNSALKAKTESHLETYYSFKINDHLTIGPDIQFIWNAYGKDSKISDQSQGVYGGRAQIDF